VQDQLQAFYQQHYSGVYYFFLRRGFPDGEAQELSQETFLRFFKSELGTSKETPEHYLKIVAANLWRNTLREASRQKREGRMVPIDDVDVVAKSGTDPLGNIIEKEHLDALRLAIASLPAQMRHCMVMRVYQGLKYREIATVLRLNIQTVKSQLSQAKTRLKGALGNAFDLSPMEE